MAGHGRAALVLASDWRLSYRTLRCAAACFDAVHVLGTAIARPLRHSRHCASFTMLPAEQPGFEIATINALCARLGITHILPGDGPGTLFLARHGAALAVPCYPVPDAASVELLEDRLRFAALCRSLGVPVPESRVVADRAALLALLPEDRSESLVAKPLGLAGSQGVYVITPQSSPRAIARIDYAPILLQSHVPGPALRAFYLCRAGQVLAEAVHATAARPFRFIAHPGIRRHAETIIAHLQHDGVIGFHVREAADGTPRFLDCNPRVWIDMERAMLAGVNVIALGLWPPAAVGSVAARPSALAPADHALLRYWLADLPMVPVMAWDRLARAPGWVSGATRQARGGAVTLD